MEILRNRVKSLRTEISEVVIVLGAESVENGHHTADKALDSCMNAFMFLGKILGYLGEGNPYEKDQLDIADWSKMDYVVDEKTNAIHQVKMLRLKIQTLIASNVFNHLLDLSTDQGQSMVKQNDRQWFITMTALTDLLKAKMWLGLYLNYLLHIEKEEDKAIRLEIEAKENEPKKEEGNVSGDRPATDEEADAERVKQIEEDNMVIYKKYLDERGVAYHKSLGYKKLKALFDAEQEVERHEGDNTGNGNNTGKGEQS
jgi:hypothetical protein